MVVRTNIMAANANRQLGVNNSALGKSLEKLSSGYRINRAGDDASGLAISEKMKAQIKGLDQASSNAQDGISLVQTAEGATTEIHNMLNRMVELATKSANGTIDNPVDRKAIQTEVDALNKEITRITDSTNFNGIKLLGGTLGGYTGTTVGASVASATLSGGSLKASDVIKFSTGTDGTVTLAANSTIGGKTVDLTDATAATAAGLTVSAKNASGIGTTTFTITVSDKTTATADLADAIGTGLTFSVTTNAKPASVEAGSFTVNADANGNVSSGLTLQVGDTADPFNKVNVTIDDLSAKGLGIDTLDVSNQESAGKSIDTIKTAINKVSTNRANLGALQNRMEYTINNLNTTSENMTNANSRIRDTDMASEMTKYTQSNILTQAAQAMLAQANQAPQQILQLLQ